MGEKVNADAVVRLDALDARDPENAHGDADAILLALVDPEVAHAYRRLVDRCAWWVTA